MSIDTACFRLSPSLSVSLPGVSVCGVFFYCLQFSLRFPTKKKLRLNIPLYTCSFVCYTLTRHSVHALWYDMLWHGWLKQAKRTCTPYNGYHNIHVYRIRICTAVSTDETIECLGFSSIHFHFTLGIPNFSTSICRNWFGTGNSEIHSQHMLLSHAMPCHDRPCSVYSNTLTLVL